MLWLWCLMPPSTIIQLYLGGQFYRGGPEKTTDQSHVADKFLSHNVVSCTPQLSVIGTDCIGSYKSKYHTITTMTAPPLVNYSYKM